MKKYRIIAELTLVATGEAVTEWLEDAHLTDGLDPTAFALQYAPSGASRLRDLGYAQAEVAKAQFHMRPVRLPLS